LTDIDTNSRTAGVASNRSVQHNLILAICCTSIFIVGMDASVLNVALPSIQHDFKASISGAQWTLDAYTLVLSCLLMVSASTADRVGRRRVFQIGLIIFSLGSLLCSLAPTLSFLIFFRMLQAVGGSMLNPVALSIITNTFIEPKMRARAIGVWGGVIGVSIAVGPLLGGALVETIGWRAIFWINVPIGLVALLMAHHFVPESKAAHARRIDPVGQALIIASLGLLIYGIIEAPIHGWHSLHIISCFIGALVSLVSLVLYETHRTEPLVDMRFFRSAPFSGATAIAVCTFISQGGFLLLNTFYLQDIRHFSPLKAGLAILPMPAMMAIIGPLSGRVVGRFGPRPSLVVGGLSISCAGLLAAFPAKSPSGFLLYCIYALIGLGIGCINTAISNTAISGMPRDQAGVAAGITSTMRQLGQTLGVAIIGTVIASHVTHLSAGSGFDAAFRISWELVAGSGFIILILAVITTGTWAKNTARHNAERMTESVAQ
jgi:EmrB/QacA subfamily drug resistance transporter